MLDKESIFNLDDAHLLMKNAKKMYGVEAVAAIVAQVDNLGADIVLLEPGVQFRLHTHPGAHTIQVLSGLGTFTISKISFNTKPGDFFSVPSNTPHAVGAHKSNSQFLLVHGSPYYAAHDINRIQFVDIKKIDLS
jgi:quercetin dioxygenase-like cupin family protein